jgi:hypothetical protein
MWAVFDCPMIPCPHQADFKRRQFRISDSGGRSGHRDGSAAAQSRAVAKLTVTVRPPAVSPAGGGLPARVPTTRAHLAEVEAAGD